MLSINGLIFDELTEDPGSPGEGYMWFNTTAHLYKIYRNGATTSFTDAVAFANHTGSTSNPHTTTLEQARTANNAVSGSIAMGSNKITGLANPEAGTDGVNLQTLTSQIAEKLRGLDWQNSVLNMTTTAPPGTPASGDRYVIASPATGDWSGKEGQIAEWNGTAWVYTVPNKGFALTNEADGIQYNYNGSAWVNIGGSVPKGTPVEITDATNAQGDGSSFAVNNHQHSHGSRGGGSLHAVTSSSGAGFAPKSHRSATVAPTVTDDTAAGYVAGSRWTDTTHGTDWVCIDPTTGAAVWKETTNIAGVLNQKAGHVLAASFAGTPKKATVTFSAAFTNANYAVTVSAVTVNGRAFAPFIESQVAGSFVICLGSNSNADLTQVNWHATKDGESA